MDPKTPKKPRPPQTEPQHVSNPPNTPPLEAPSTPKTEYENEVPHSGNEPIAKLGKTGEGSYEGTRQYDEGLEQFTEGHDPDASSDDARKIDPDDPELKRAERRAKDGPRPSSPSAP